MTIRSAGILPYRLGAGGVEVMLVHPGGPFWVHRDAGAWSLAKGLIEDGETPLAAARREFAEETGFEVDGDFIDLGELKQPSGKRIRAFALELDLDVARVESNTFAVEWPRGSGVLRRFPEIDRAAWFLLDEAHGRILAGQRGFLDRLLKRLAGRGRVRIRP